MWQMCGRLGTAGAFGMVLPLLEASGYEANNRDQSPSAQMMIRVSYLSVMLGDGHMHQDSHRLTDAGVVHHFHRLFVN